MSRIRKQKLGLSLSVIRALSRRKGEPKWMLDQRLNAYALFKRMPMPAYGPSLSELKFDEICYFYATADRPFNSWDQVPIDMKQTFEVLGIPQLEQYALAGVGAQYESDVVYKQVQDQWSSQGVIFCSMDEAVREHLDLVQRYFGTLVSTHDNKFAALNVAVWSGGSFMYVPEGVSVELPLHAYFRMQSEGMGQFERTLLIAERGSSVHYIEGCSAPLYSKNALHAAVVEIFAYEGAHVRYTTIQNWSKNVYNLVTKRAYAHKNARVEWVDGNFGSKVTMKYPCIVLAGEHAHGTVISLAVAGEGQEHDTGAKIIHQAPYTSAQVLSKSIVQSNGCSIYRGCVVVDSDAKNAQSHVQCDSLMLDSDAQTRAEPVIRTKHDACSVGHEATVASCDEQQLWYCATRGINANVARSLIINGFADIFVNELPMEYAVELNRLLALYTLEQS